MGQSHMLEDTLLPSLSSETILWRYLDLAKLLAMLHHAGLYCTRADQLDDPFEGRFSTRSVEAFRQTYNLTAKQAQSWADVVRTIPRNSYLTCWHESEVESVALWRLYGQSIALRSTFGRLRAFLPDHYHIDRVTYISSYDTDGPDINPSVGPLLCKRSAFSHEREVRGISQYHTRVGGVEVPAQSSAFLPGEYVKGDLNDLVERVVVAPGAPPWYYDTVYHVTEKYGLLSHCLRSDLDLPPPLAHIPEASFAD